jgi:hypothetical protein
VGGLISAPLIGFLLDRFSYLLTFMMVLGTDWVMGVLMVRPVVPNH